MSVLALYSLMDADIHVSTIWIVPRSWPGVRNGCASRVGLQNASGGGL